MHTTSARLGANHGYRFEGDQAFLNAELSFAREVAGEGWALQLWACDAPYQGGPLRGIKVAEAALDGATDRLEANALAQLPPMQRDYAMVLVLAADGQVHDFSNYPARQAFVGPHLAGSVGYRFLDNREVALQANVRNARPGNLSGTLALELWALPAPYEGSLAAGQMLAQAQLGCLAGEASHEVRVQCAEAPAGTWRVALLLREWTEAGYQTRDFCNFPVPYEVQPAVPQPAETKPAEVKVAEPQAERKLAETKPAEAVAPKLALKALADARVSLSKASAEQLAAVPGLNLKLAQAIVRARPFKSVDDLTRVRGIGSKMLAQLRAQLTP